MIISRRPTAFDVLAMAGVVVPPVLVLIGLAPASLCLVSVLVCMLCLLWAIRSRAGSVLLVFVSVAFVAAAVSGPGPNMRPPDGGGRNAVALAAQWRSDHEFKPDLPIVLHIVFDEMMSPGAIEDEVEGGAAVRQALQDSATAHGMRMFDSIYSRRYYSGVSLPNLMNAEFDGRMEASHLTSDIQGIVGENSYFSEMARRGYRTAVFQSAVMDYCQASGVELCETFGSYDPAEAARSSQSMKVRVLSLSETLLRTYQPGYLAQFGLDTLSDVYGIGGGDERVHGNSGRYDPQGFVKWFDYFAAFVERVPKGTHVFAHFLVPHAPYLLDSSCQTGGTVSSGYSLVSQVPDPKARPPVRLREYASYLEQVACVGRKIDELLERLDAIGTFRDATILIHGDHGSRISNGFQVEDLESRDLIDNYATYFAIKTPGLEPGTDCEFTSLPQIFRRFMNPDAAGTAEPMGPLPVLVATRAAEGARVEVSMPRFGCAATAEATSQPSVGD